MGKRGQMWDTLVPWIVAIIVIVLVVFSYAVISGRLGGLGELIRNTIHFR